MVARVLRRLQGITYWAITDKAEIRRFINTNVRREWEEDNEKDGVDSRKDDWLLNLSKRKWRLVTVYVGRIMIDPAVMARPDFEMRLKQRSQEMRRSISSYGSVIWPLVIRGEDYELRDGYCRFATLRSMGINKVLAYVGFMSRR